MQGKFTALFRKMELNGNTYYQCDFVVPEFAPNERFDSLQNRMSSDKSQFYITATEEQLNKRGIRPKNIFVEHNGLILVQDKNELTYVSSKFEESLQKVVEKNVYNQPEDLINGYINKIYDDTKCHKKAIKELVQTIVFNRDLNNSTIPTRDKYLSHDNIVLYGPIGCGKSMIVDSLKKNLQIPVINIELSEYVEDNREMIVDALLNSDKEFNGHAVVICDLDFNKFGGLFEGDSFYPLKELSNSSNDMYSPYLKKPVNFRNLTFVTVVNVAENMLEYGNLDNYFIHMSGCSKAIGVKRLTMTDIRRILYGSIYSQLKFCREQAKKYGREFEDDKTAIATMIKYCDIFNGNIMHINTAIMEDFKEQLHRGNHKIVIGKDSFAILKGILEAEKENGWIKDAPNNEVIEEENEEDEEDKSEALRRKNKLIQDISSKIKETIKGQDSQVKSIVKTLIDNQEYANDPNLKNPEKRKANILVRGSSGTGKTEIIRQVASIINIPMRVEDATEYTEVGYVGDSAKDMLVHILNEAGGNLEKAERGIIVIDEIDKKANNPNQHSDVTRGAVLDSLLKMIEGEKYDLEIKVNTPAGPGVQKVTFDTRRLTFAILGAFDGLDKFREARIKTASKPKSMGFQTEAQQDEAKKELDGINKGFISEDYVAYGFTDQFTNRFDKKIYLNKLTRENLLDIAKNSISSPLVLLQEDYAKYGIDITYTEDFYEKIADIAFTKKSGARSIKEVFEDLKTFIGFDDLDLSDYKQVIFNAKCFDDPNALVLVEKDKQKVIKK